MDLHQTRIELNRLAQGRFGIGKSTLKIKQDTEVSLRVHIVRLGCDQRGKLRNRLFRPIFLEEFTGSLRMLLRHYAALRYAAE